jgi:hypothetical protein
MSKANLDWLLFPYSKALFAKEFFEEGYLHISRADSQFYSHLLQIDGLDALLGSRQFKFPALRLTKAGEELTSDKYTNDKNIDLSAVQKYFLEGYTIILNALHDQNQALGELVNVLSHELGHPFQTNVYITPPSSQGFPAHYDTHEVFVLQIEGSKVWRIYNQSPEILPTKQMEFQKEKHPTPSTFTEIELKKGDLLYIPRGVMHDAQTNSELSVHVTLGWLGYTWTDALVQMLLEFSKKHAISRKFIDPFKNSSVADLDREFTDVMQNFMNYSKPHESVNQFRKELAANQKFFFGDLLKNTVKFNQISAATGFIKREIASLNIIKSTDEVILKIATKEISFPNFTFRTIEFILNRNDLFTINDLPDDLDDEGKMVLLRRLVKEGVITIN